MGKLSNLEKRIKRHVNGKVREYFIATAPGLESLCHQEWIESGMGGDNAQPVPGGVRFYGRFRDCMAANLYLRTANRILMRIHAFKATSFFQMENHLESIPWELFVFPDQPITVHVRCHHSKLYHSTAIAKRCELAVNKRLASVMGPETIDESDAVAQQIFIRGINNRFTISLDSSGPLLYKRFPKARIAKAPIRPTLAAAILKLARYRPPEPLIDPMCGSGTFALEAAMMATNMAPGLFRDFAFMHWPAFRAQAWEYMKQNASKQIRYPNIPCIFASDNDKTVCNLLENRLKEYGFTNIIQVNCADALRLEPTDFTRETGLVVLNPPYGYRIGSLKQSRELFSQLWAHLKVAYQGWKLAIIVPDTTSSEIIPFRLNRFPLFHGGRKHMLMTGIIR